MEDVCQQTEMNTDDCEDDLNLQLMVAAQQGNIERLQEILDTGIDINSQDLMFSETAIVGACRYGCTEIVHFLISKGANVNMQTKNGSTALHVAVLNSQVPCVEFLLESTDIQKDVQDELGMTPVMLAAHRGLHREMKMLAQHGCKLDITNCRGQSAIHLTQLPYKGHVGNRDGFMCLKELTSFDIDINAKDNLGMTPLHYAIKGGNFQSVKWLVSENCDMDVVASTQTLCPESYENLPLPVTPLSLAVYFLNVRVVKLLLDCGCARQGYTNIIKYSEKHPELHILLSSSFLSPESLKISSRQMIRKTLGKHVKTKVECLVLPTPLKEFLLMERELQ